MGKSAKTSKSSETDHHLLLLLNKAYKVSYNVQEFACGSQVGNTG